MHDVFSTLHAFLRRPYHEVNQPKVGFESVIYDRGKLRAILNVPNGLNIVLVVALGYPAENPIVDKMKDGDTKCWLGQNGVLHVSKRDLEDMVRWSEYHTH